MSAIELQRRADAYLATREALGLSTRAMRRLLEDFVRYVAVHGGCGPIRAQLAVDWACGAHAHRSASGQAHRLSVARGFLAHLQASLPETEVPETGLLAALRRPRPYLFSPAQLGQLLEAVSHLGPRGSLRPHTYYALIGLLASTGLRAGEALRLTVADVRLDDDPPCLRIVQTKFGKSRLVPLHPSTAQKLRDYAQLRRRLGYHALGEVFFLSETGKALDYSVLWRTFARLTRRLGLWPVEGRRPSLHALRHTFAVERLASWYRAGVDVRALAPSLSVYLGHVHPEESYWYFTATPELLEAAAYLFERYAEGGGS